MTMSFGSIVVYNLVILLALSSFLYAKPQVEMLRSDAESCNPDGNARCVPTNRCALPIELQYEDFSDPAQPDIRLGIFSAEFICNVERRNLDTSEPMTCCETSRILPEQEVQQPGVPCSEIEDYKCVPQHECRDGRIITDGENLLTIRSGGLIDLNVQGSKCPSDLEVCCYEPMDYREIDSVGEIPSDEKEKVTPRLPPTASKDYQPGCGRRNIYGFSVTIQEPDDPTQAQFAEWPNMCILQIRSLVSGNNVFQGGASLITPGVVITVAHYVNETQPGLVTIRCGEWDTKRVVEPLLHQERRAKHITIHPRFTNKGYPYNIAVIHLERDFVLSKHIDTVCLPNINEENPSYDGNNCFAPGWGKEKIDSDEYQTVLKNIRLPIMERGLCQERLRTTRLTQSFKLGKDIICAGGEDEDTCKGDGGGPLMCASTNIPGSYVQVGITSWGIGCGQKGIPGAYTSVSKTLCFIRWAVECFSGDAYDKYLGPAIEDCDQYLDKEIEYFDKIVDYIRKRKAGYTPGSAAFKNAETNENIYETFSRKAYNLRNSCNAIDRREEVDIHRQFQRVSPNLAK